MYMYLFFFRLLSALSSSPSASVLLLSISRTELGCMVLVLEPMEFDVPAVLVVDEADGTEALLDDECRGVIKRRRKSSFVSRVDLYIKYTVSNYAIM